MHCPNCQQLGLKVLAKSGGSNSCMYQRAKLVNANIHNHLTRCSIRWVSSGKYHYHIASNKYHLTPSSFLLLNDGQIYNAHTLGSSSVANIHTISFENKFVVDAFNQILHKDEHLLDEPIAFNKIEHGFVENKYPMNATISHILLRFERIEEALIIQSEEDFAELLLSLAHSQYKHKSQLRSLKALKLSTRVEIYRRILPVYEWLHAHPNQSFNLTQMATMASLSPFHFLRCFKQAFGISPYKLQMQLRVQLAKAEMANSKKSLTEIAFYLGFEDLSSFSHAFKKIEGISPSTFLKT